MKHEVLHPSSCHYLLLSIVRSYIGHLFPADRAGSTPIMRPSYRCACGVLGRLGSRKINCDSSSWSSRRRPPPLQMSILEVTATVCTSEYVSQSPKLLMLLFQSPSFTMLVQVCLSRLHWYLIILSALLSLRLCAFSPPSFPSIAPASSFPSRKRPHGTVDAISPFIQPSARRQADLGAIKSHTCKRNPLRPRSTVIPTLNLLKLLH